MELRARYTLFAEGCRGSLTKRLIERFGLRDGPRSADLRARHQGAVGDPGGEPPARAGRAHHRLAAGLAAPMAARSCIISATNLVSYGFVVGLDYRNPWLSPFEEMQRFKTHPAVRRPFRGRPAHQLRRAGAERGRAAVDSRPGVPRRRADRRRRGVPQRAEDQGHAHLDEVGHAGGRGGGRGAGGRASGGARPPIRRSCAQAGCGTNCRACATSARRSPNSACGAGWPMPASTPTCSAARRRGRCTIAIRDNETLMDAASAPRIEYPKPDGVLTFDRLSSVFISNTNHEENQPPHLHLRDPAMAIAVNWEQLPQPGDALLPGRGLRDRRRGRRQRRGCRSTRRTACTARPATSRTRRRTSTG